MKKNIPSDLPSESSESGILSKLRSLGHVAKVSSVVTMLAAGLLTENVNAEDTNPFRTDGQTPPEKLYADAGNGSVMGVASAGNRLASEAGLPETTTNTPVVNLRNQIESLQVKYSGESPDAKKLDFVVRSGTTQVATLLTGLHRQADLIIKNQQEKQSWYINNVLQGLMSQINALRTKGNDEAFITLNMDFSSLKEMGDGEKRLYLARDLAKKYKIQLPKQKLAQTESPEILAARKFTTWLFELGNSKLKSPGEAVRGAFIVKLARELDGIASYGGNNFEEEKKEDSHIEVTGTGNLSFKLTGNNTIDGWANHLDGAKCKMQNVGKGLVITTDSSDPKNKDKWVRTSIKQYREGQDGVTPGKTYAFGTFAKGDVQDLYLELVLEGDGGQRKAVTDFKRSDDGATSSMIYTCPPDLGFTPKKTTLVIHHKFQGKKESKVEIKDGYFREVVQ